MLTWFRWTTLMSALGAASYYGYRAIPWSCMDVTVSAYWVQAIGSIAAILGAFFLGERQANKALTAALQVSASEESRRLASIFAICTAAQKRAHLIKQILTAENGEPGFTGQQYNDYLIDGIIEALNSIPIHELGNAEAALSIIEMRDNFRFLIPCINNLRANYPFDKIRKENRFDVNQQNILIYLDAIQVRYDALQNTIGGNV